MKESSVGALTNGRDSCPVSLRRRSVPRLESYLRDSNILIIGFLVVVIGWVLQTTSSISCASAICGNAGTVLQLIATASIIAGLLILAIGFLNFTRRVERHIYSPSQPDLSRIDAATTAISD